MTDHEDNNHEREKNGLKSVVKAIWNRLRSRHASSALQTAIKAVVATTVAGGLAIGAVGYAQAAEAKKELAAVQHTLSSLTTPVTIPIPPDLTEAVGQSQTAADNAQSSADAAKGDAATAKTMAQGASASATAAQTSADTAQSSANQALASVPVFRQFPTSVISTPATNTDYTIGEFDLKAGTYRFEEANTCSPTTNISHYQYIVARVKDDGTLMTIVNMGAVGSCPQNRLAYASLQQDSHVRVYWHVTYGDDVVHSMGQQTLQTTKVNLG